MTQYVDLAGDARWSEADIVGRMEAQIRTHCSATEELIIHRKLLGATLPLLLTAAGMPVPEGVAYSISPEEVAEVAAYGSVCFAAQAAGRQARLDAALLNRVLDAEQGVAPLADDDTDGNALAATRATARAAAAPAPAPEGGAA